METRAPSERHAELDGLRGIAILLVVTHHYLFLPFTTPSVTVSLFQRILGLGWSGVDLFFVLSGFLLGGILIDHRDSSGYFETFYLRRACRILPLYFLVVATLIGLRRVFPQSGELGTLPALSYFTFTHNFLMAAKRTLDSACFAPTWSLAVEEQFYLFLPFLIRFVPLSGLPFVAAGLAVSAPLLRAIHFHADPGGSFLSPYVLLPFRADGLFTGVLCACLFRSPWARRSAASYRTFLYGLIAAGIAAVGLLVAKSPFRNQAGMGIFGYSVFALLYGAILLLVLANRGGMFARLARIGTLRRLGLISYGVYLLHTPCLALAYRIVLGRPIQIEPPRFSVVVCATLLTWGLAELSWKFLEKPCIAWGHRRRYAELPPRGTAAAELSAAGEPA